MRKSPLSHEISKNVLIGFVLLFAFFPLYVMLVISFKDNTQFVHNPFLPTAPFHWENWVVGWGLIHNYIANSILVAVLSVSLTLVTALFSAYVFARYTFPGKSLLWYLFLSCRR